MKAVVLLALVAACVAQEAGPTAVAAGKHEYSPQDMFLGKESVGNFACRVDSVSVTLDDAGEEDKVVITTEDLTSFLSQTASLEWAHVNQFFFSSLDGRNDEKNLGTGGGDLGEFIQGLEAYTKVTGIALTQEEVDQLLERYLKIMTRPKFFYSTDERSYRKLAIATGCQNLQIASISDKHKKKDILSKLASDEMGDFIGDPFLKFLANNAAELGFNREYISFGLQAFHNNLWKHTSEADKLCYTMVKGRSDPKALVHVKTPGYCVDQGLAPLISSQTCAGQIFVEHTDAVKLFRRELVQLISRPGDNPQDILAEFNTLAQGNLQKFWESYTGLPSFTVTFSNSNLE